MPAIVIKEYTWHQTSEFVTLRVPLFGSPKKIDFFVIDNYVKISFPPFILELFLWSNVDEGKSKCTVTDQKAVLSLRKVDVDSVWPKLHLDDIDNETKRKYRNQALERAHLVAEERAKARSEQRQCLQKEAVKAQINIDTAKLNEIEMKRDAHRKEAMQELEDWRSNAEIPILQDVEGEIQENRKAYRPPLKWFKDEDGTLKSRPLTNEEVFNSGTSRSEIQSSKLKALEWKGTSIIGSSENVNDERKKITRDNEVVDLSSDEQNPVTEATESIVKIEEIKENPDVTASESSSSEDSESDYDIELPKRSSTKETNEEALQKLYKKKTKHRPGQELIDRILRGKSTKRNSIFEDPRKSVPLPRRNGIINVTFSERVFPTPARESSKLQEQEWLQKQAEARRKTGFVAEDLRPEERDPQWLKDKGDDFFKVGNYLGAVSAYTYGIKISNKMASLYASRSAAQYALENYHRCIEDCTKALELMEPKCEGNRESRAGCHARRGAALCKLSAPQHGIPELEAALELAPDNESIKHDLLAVKQHFDIKD